MDCILCDRQITSENDSEEHLLPQAIGGRLKVKSLLCRDCNGWTGREWDSTLCEQLNWFSLVLGITRERGTPPAMPVRTAAGHELLLLADGSLTPRHPTFKERATPDSRTALEIVARDRADARRLIKQASRRYPTLDVDAALKSAVDERRYLESPIQLSIDFGGPRTGRSIVKTALVFAAHHGIDHKQCGPGLQYLRAADPHPEASQAVPPFSPIPAPSQHTDAPPLDPPFNYYYARDILVSRPDRALHGVAISSRGTEGQLLAYVEYFEARRCVVQLIERYTGAELHISHFVDPVNGETVDQEFDLGLGRSEIEAMMRGERADGEKMLEAFSAVISRAMRTSMERERNRLLSAAVEAGFSACGLQPGQEITAEHIGLIARMVAERMAPFIAAQRRRQQG